MSLMLLVLVTAAMAFGGGDGGGKLLRFTITVVVLRKLTLQMVCSSGLKFQRIRAALPTGWSYERWVVHLFGLWCTVGERK